MLPHGIYLWESGFEGMAEPISPADLQGAHPNISHGPYFDADWSDVLEIQAVGSLRRCAVESDSVIVIIGACSSTMEVARYLMEQSVLSKWGAVIATEQSSGRGQLRRPWVSPVGNLHMSVVMPSPPVNSAWTWSLRDLLPLVAGYVFSDVLGGLGANLSIKWPNDLLQEDRKVGGILIEEQAGKVILGLGMNCVESPPDSLMREDRSVEAAVLQTKSQLLNPLELGETLVNRGESVYEVLLDEFTPTQFISMMALRLAWLGRRVEVRESGNDSYIAVIAGVSPKGGLVIRYEGKERILFSGSVFPL